MTRDEMIDKLKFGHAVAHDDIWTTRACIDVVIAALRSRPAPQDDLVALVRDVLACAWQLDNKPHLMFSAVRRLALAMPDDVTDTTVRLLDEARERAYLLLAAPVAVPAPKTPPCTSAVGPGLHVAHSSDSVFRRRASEAGYGYGREAEMQARYGAPAGGYQTAPETPAPDAMPEIEFGDDVVWQTKPKPERVAEVICKGSRYEKRMTIHEWREHFRHKQVTAIERNGVVIWRRQEAQP